MSTAISPLAMLLSGLALKQAQNQPAPSIAAALPKQPLSITAMPRTDTIPAPPTAVAGNAPTGTVSAGIPETMGSGIVRSMMPSADSLHREAATARRAGIQSDVEQYAKPLDPNQYKPKWYDRLFAGMTTFGAAMQHNPNAVELGTSQMNQRFNRAEYQRQSGLKGAQENLEAFDKGEKLYDESFDREMRNRQFGQNQTKMENTFDSDIQQETGTDGKVHYYKVSQTGRRIEVPEPASVVTDRWRTADEKRRAEADAQKAKSDDRRWDEFSKRTDAMFARGNKADKPNEFDAWKEAFVRDNGREPTAQEIADRKYHPSGSSSTMTFKDKDAIVKWDDQWYKERRDRVRKDKTEARLNSAVGGDKSGINEEYAAIEKQYNDEAAEHERVKKEAYAAVGSGRVIRVTNNRVEDAAESSPAKPATSGQPDTVRVQAPDGRTGVIPKANLQKALKAGYKQLSK